MRIAVFGSSGKTGQQLVTQALERGHTVVAAARTPQKLDALRHERLEVVACDVLEPATLPPAVAGVDAVLITIGGVGIGDGETRATGTGHILDAMKAAGVARVLIVSTAGVGDSIQQLGLVARLFVQTVIRKAVADHTRQEAAVRASGMRWTIARPGGLTDGPVSPNLTADATGSLRVTTVSRAGVARFLLDALEDPATEGQIYALSDAR